MSQSCQTVSIKIYRRMRVLAFTTSPCLRVAESPPELGGPDDLTDDEGVEDDDGDVGYGLHEDDLAPEHVERHVERVLPQLALPHRSLVRVLEHVLLHLEELHKWKVTLLLVS